MCVRLHMYTKGHGTRGGDSFGIYNHTTLALMAAATLRVNLSPAPRRSMVRELTQNTASNLGSYTASHSDNVGEVTLQQKVQ